MRVVLSGGTGFIGRHLAARLAARGDEISILTRSGKLPEELSGTAGVQAVAWDPPAPGAWQKSIDGADAIVHLAGEQAVGKRHTAAVRERILVSRVASAERLVEAIGAAAHKPRVFVSASGVDYYGGRSDGEPVDESSPAGSDPLSEVCVQWEAAARAAEPHGVRVAIARFGVVFSGDGGPLQTMALPFKLLVGGKLGNGRQYFCWIHLEDALRALLLLLDDDGCRGAFNVVATAVPQAELAHTLGKVLHRPSFIPAPGFALKLLFGEGARPLLTGRNAVPRALRERGFEWRFAEVLPALEECFARRS